MNSPQTQLLDMASDFVRLQHALLTTWLNANSGSHDLETLLDFPKQCTIGVDSQLWQATRHGLGVRFVGPSSRIVDVPFAVTHRDAFDPGRLFDFVVSHPPDYYQLLTRQREAFYTLFDTLVQSRLFTIEPDSLHRPLFAIRSD
jgi:hypothetical protein